MSAPTSSPVVIVSTFPPRHCGIGRYAHQQVEWLRREGNRVLTLGLPGSQADSVVEVRGATRPLSVIAAVEAHGLVPRQCRLVVHWHDDLYYAGGFRSRILTSWALSRLFRRFLAAEIVCHETYPPEPARTWAHAILRSAFAGARRAAWLHASTIAFHSQQERSRAERALEGPIPESKVVIRPHGAYLRRYRDVDRLGARTELGLPENAVLFLCIGFLAPHKGFHHAVQAFRSVGSADAILAVVGSVRDADPEAERYVDDLRAQCAQDGRIRLRTEYLSDEAYDTWNAAADVVVAPYERAFSSSVIERAKLFGARILATDVGGIADQLGPDDRLVRSHAELATAMASLSRECTARSTPSRP